MPRADAHQGENVAPRDERLAWLTSFTGSAGLAVVDRASAPASSSTAATGCRCGARSTPTLFAVLRHPEDKPADWLAEALPGGGRLGFDPWLHTAKEIETLTEALAPRQIALVRVANLVDRVWADQPPPPARPIVRAPGRARRAERGGEARRAGARAGASATWRRRC